MDWASFFEGAAAGGAVGFSLKVVIDIRRTGKTVRSSTDESMRNVTQRDNKVGGDLAGRDISKRT